MAEKKEINLEREYTIPLREKCRSVARYKKTPKAVKTIKEFLVQHMKIYDRDLNKIKIDPYLNEFLWFRGIRYPPHKIKIKAIKQGEIVTVTLAEMPAHLKFKKARHEKRDSKAAEAGQKSKSFMERAKEGLQKPKDGSDKPEKETPEEKSVEKEKQKAIEQVNNKIEKELTKQHKHDAKAEIKTLTKKDHSKGKQGQ